MSDHSEQPYTLGEIIVMFVVGLATLITAILPFLFRAQNVRLGG